MPFINSLLARTKTWSRLEWACLLFALLVGEWFIIRSVAHYPLRYDAGGYWRIALELKHGGLFIQYFQSETRTYGYVALLIIPISIGQLLGHGARVLALEGQLFLYLFASLAVRNVLRSTSPQFAKLVYCGLCLNIFALIYTADVLTESLSVSAILLMFTLIFPLRKIPWSFSRHMMIFFTGGFILAYNIEIRPANIAVVPAYVAFGVSLLISEVTDPRVRVWRLFGFLILTTIGMSCAFVPQMINNSRNYDRLTPLPVRDLQTFQELTGIGWQKYATGVPPAPAASIIYDNPLAKGTTLDWEHPLRWYTHYPARGAGTLALHTFNMLDQDLLFTYAPDLHPLWRSALGVYNHAIVALSLVGCAFWGAAARKGGQHRRLLRAGLACLAVYVLGLLAVYATTAVEMRFGLPLLLVMFPLAVIGISGLTRLPATRLLVVVAAVLVYVGLALSVSDWVRRQSPAIRSSAETGILPTDLLARHGLPLRDEPSALLRLS